MKKLGGCTGIILAHPRAHTSSALNNYHCLLLSIFFFISSNSSYVLSCTKWFKRAVELKMQMLLCVLAFKALFLLLDTLPCKCCVLYIVFSSYFCRIWRKCENTLLEWMTVDGMWSGDIMRLTLAGVTVIDRKSVV